MNSERNMPLAARIRPSTIDEMVGQRHLLAPGRPLRKIIESGHVPNMVFYGPSGIGKTTLAHIIAAQTNKSLYKLNATVASTGDIKDIITSLDSLQNAGGVILYLDEIQYFNKKQQQILLDYIENGSITLIASTAENPYFYVYNAILSRSTVFEFKPPSAKEIEPAVIRAFDFISKDGNLSVKLEDRVVSRIAQSCGGDVRKAMNAVELLCVTKTGQTEINVTLEAATALSQRSNMKYDRDGDSHYDILSAFQKSIRGSDENAALHYLARLLAAGDLPSVCRRMLVIAAEDIGLAYPQAITVVKSCVDAALQLGMPEARIPLAEGVILMATAPKSNSAICAIDAASEDLNNRDIGDIPAHLKDSHYSGAAKLGRGTEYKYPHLYPDHYTPQQYLPDALKDRVYYTYGENKLEQAAKKYWTEIKNKDGKK